MPHCLLNRTSATEVWRWLHWKVHLLSFAYSAQRSLLNRAKWSLFGWVQMQRLFSNTFSRSWNLPQFMKISSSKKYVLESQRFWPIMISSPRSEIWANLDCDTCELESAVIFSIQTEHKTRTACFNEYAFQKEKGANGWNQSSWFKCNFHQLQVFFVQVDKKETRVRVRQEWKGGSSWSHYTLKLHPGMCQYRMFRLLHAYLSANVEGLCYYSVTSVQRWRGWPLGSNMDTWYGEECCRHSGAQHTQQLITWEYF